MNTRKSDLYIAQNLKKMQQKMRDIDSFKSIPVNIEWKERNSNILYSSYY